MCIIPSVSCNLVNGNAFARDMMGKRVETKMDVNEPSTELQLQQLCFVNYNSYRNGRSASNRFESLHTTFRANICANSISALVRPAIRETYTLCCIPGVIDSWRCFSLLFVKACVVVCKGFCSLKLVQSNYFLYINRIFQKYLLQFQWKRTANRVVRTGTLYRSILQVCALFIFT